MDIQAYIVPALALLALLFAAKVLLRSYHTFKR